MRIRLAKHDDLTLIAQVYRESIAKLCARDYEAETIQAWQHSSKPEDRQSFIDSGSLWVVDAFSRSSFDQPSEQALISKSPPNMSLKSSDKQSGLAGFMVVIPGEIVSLFIHPDFSGLGVGKKLAEIGIQIARKGRPVVQLESTMTALPFYQKLGFVEVSRGFFSQGNTELKIPVVNMTLTF